MGMDIFGRHRRMTELSLSLAFALRANTRPLGVAVGPGGAAAKHAFPASVLANASTVTELASAGPTTVRASSCHCVISVSENNENTVF